MTQYKTIHRFQANLEIDFFSKIIVSEIHFKIENPFFSRSLLITERICLYV